MREINTNSSNLPHKKIDISHFFSVFCRTLKGNNDHTENPMNPFATSTSCAHCLCKSPVFESLTPEELRLFNQSRYKLSYKAGETIFKQGGVITHVMSFVSGLAKVYIEGPGNHNLIIKLLTPGEIAGGPGLGTDNKLHYTISAIEDCQACFIDVNVFSAAMKTNNNFALALYSHVNSHTVTNFQKFISLTQKQMPGRIADALLYLSRDIYRSNPFRMSISRQDLADLTALAKESVIRILKKFKDEEIISESGDMMHLLRVEELERISIIG